MHSSTQGYTLNPGVSFCLTSGRAIFLDQIADRYLALDTAADQAFVRLLKGLSLTEQEENQIDILVEQGFLSLSDGGPVPRQCGIGLPTSIVALSNLRRPSGLAQLCFAWRVMTARRQLRRHGLYKSLQAFRIARTLEQKGSLSPASIVREAADLLHTISRYMTRHDQCLPISLGLARYLQRRGVDCQLVLGVQLGPFQAHCWVQHGHQLIGEDLDMVRTFTPILVV